MRRGPGLVALLAALVLLTSCTGGGTDGSPSTTPGPWRGGTLRVGTSLAPAVQLDPLAYGYGFTVELYRCCLLRTLFSYSGVSGSEGGGIARPDLAVGEPEVSPDGLVWTFRLREGLRYAPPFDDTEIVAGDIVWAMERLGDPKTLDVAARTVRGSYAFYFDQIQGFRAFTQGTASSISGLETPDDHTLVVRLTEPTSDLPYRFTFEGTAPLPAGAADGHLLDYVRFLVASGPYMIEGSEDLDPTLPPADQQPVSGFVPNDHMTLVRNPSWHPADDPLRPAWVDGIELDLAPWRWLDRPSTIRRFAERMDAGSIDVLSATVSPEQVSEYLADPQLRERVHRDPETVLWFMPLNVAQPPFDDVQVRRAVNLAIDKAAIADRVNRRFAADRVVGPIDHLLPDGLAGGLVPPGWAPPWAEGTGPSGDLEAARERMAASRYDRDHDGRCDDPSCRNVLVYADARICAEGADGADWAPIVERNLSELGIDLDVRVLPYQTGPNRYPFPEAIWSPDGHVATILSCSFRWASDYPSAATFIVPLLDAHSITEVQNNNLSLLGAGPEQLRSWGYEVTEVPSADERIDACTALVGSAQTECWAELDQYLSTEIVPWVPLMTEARTFLVSDRVDRYAFDVYGQRPALDQISLIPGSE